MTEAYQTTFIYALTCPKSETVRYVGKSNDPKKRLRSHLRDAPLARYHRSEHCRRISEGQRGKIIPLEARAKMSAAKLGKPLSLECRAKMSAARKGRKPSAETAAKSAASRSKDVVLLSPAGECIEVRGIAPFCRQQNLGMANLCSQAKKRPPLRGLVPRDRAVSRAAGKSAGAEGGAMKELRFTPLELVQMPKRDLEMLRERTNARAWQLLGLTAERCVQVFNDPPTGDLVIRAD